MFDCDHHRLVCATWNRSTNRLDDPFVDGRQIGASNGGGFREVRCNQGPVAARDSVIGSMYLSSTLRGDVPIPYVIDDMVELRCFSTDSPTSPVYVPKFGAGTDDGDERRARGETECPGTNQAVGTVKWAVTSIDLGLSAISFRLRDADGHRVKENGSSTLLRIVGRLVDD